MDKDTLIVGDHIGQQLVKYTVNTAARTCKGEVMDSGYQPYSVSCSEDGKVYVTDNVKRNILKIYDVKTGDKEEWEIKEKPEYYPIISMNNEFIVISSGRFSYVYDKDRVFLYKLTHHQVSQYLRTTYVTDTSVFWGAEANGGKGVVIMNLLTNDTKMSKEFTPEGVAGTKKGYVYVTDSNRDDVGVYSRDGTFLNHLQIDPPVTAGILMFSGAVRLSDDDALIAFSNWIRDTPIAVYKTHQ